MDTDITQTEARHLLNLVKKDIDEYRGRKTSTASIRQHTIKDKLELIIKG